MLMLGTRFDRKKYCSIYCNVGYKYNNLSTYTVFFKGGKGFKISMKKDNCLLLNCIFSIFTFSSV